MLRDASISSLVVSTRRIPADLKRDDEVMKLMIDYVGVGAEINSLLKVSVDFQHFLKFL